MKTKVEGSVPYLLHYLHLFWLKVWTQNGSGVMKEGHSEGTGTVTMFLQSMNNMESSVPIVQILEKETEPKKGCFCPRITLLKNTFYQFTI